MITPKTPIRFHYYTSSMGSLVPSADRVPLNSCVLWAKFKSIKINTVESHLYMYIYIYIDIYIYTINVYIYIQ